MASLEIAMYTAFIAFILYCILNLCILLNLNRNPNHPLPPGPKPWPIVGNLPHLGPKPHQSIAAMARTYGPLMHIRLGFDDVIVAASASVAAQFLKIHDTNFSNRPRRLGAKYLLYDYRDLVSATYGPRWRMLRKASHVNLFSNQALDHFHHVRQEEVDVLTRSLASATEAPVNLASILNVCITNLLAMVILGKRMFCDGSGDVKSDEFKDMVVEITVLAGVFNVSDFVPALEWLDLQGLTAKMKNLHARFDRFLSDILEDHKINGGGGVDGKSTTFLSRLISLKDNADGEGGKLTDIDIKALLLDMFTAGTDTTSSTVEWVIAELIRHPKILAKAQQELDSVVGQDRLVTELDIPQLPYLQAIVKENFRLHPSTPLSIPRTAAESCEINGYHIPKGSNLFVNVWAISRDPDVWVEPLEFRPDRFLPSGDKSNVDVKGNDFELIPFGAGRRICVGVSLGVRMVQLLTATLIHAFDWKLPAGQMPEKLNMEEAFGVTLQRAVPLAVHPLPRLPQEVYRTLP